MVDPGGNRKRREGAIKTFHCVIISPTDGTRWPPQMRLYMKLLFIVSTLIAVTCFVFCRKAPPTSISSTPKSSSSSPAPKDDWHQYSPPDKTFSVEVPCEPTQRNVSASPTPVYEYACVMEDTGGLRFFTISVGTADSRGAKTHDERAFERSVKESFTPNHRIVKLIPIKVEGGLGREVFVTNTRDEMDNLRGRVIIFGTHRFEVGYLATDIKLLESPEADRFLASFKPGVY